MSCVFVTKPFNSPLSFFHSSIFLLPRHSAYSLLQLAMRAKVLEDQTEAHEHYRKAKKGTPDEMIPFSSDGKSFPGTHLIGRLCPKKRGISKWKCTKDKQCNAPHGQCRGVDGTCVCAERYHGRKCKFRKLSFDNPDSIDMFPDQHIRRNPVNDEPALAAPDMVKVRQPRSVKESKELGCGGRFNCLVLEWDQRPDCDIGGVMAEWWRDCEQDEQGSTLGTKLWSTAEVNKTRNQSTPLFAWPRCNCTTAPPSVETKASESPPLSFTYTRKKEHRIQEGPLSGTKIPDSRQRATNTTTTDPFVWTLPSFDAPVNTVDEVKVRLAI